MISSEVTGERGLAPVLSSNASIRGLTAGRTVLWPLLVILAAGTFYLSTIRDGHGWGDDFGMYINHARNIAEGKAYADTGYIYNPHFIIGPKTYPPILPLLLAPVYKVWGVNLTAMKVVVILIFVLALIAIYIAFRNEIQEPYLTALIALVGFNPQFWVFKDNILSDLPFLLFTYLSFHLIHEAYRDGQTRASQIIYALLISVSIYLAYGTRSIGLVLIPCLFVYHVIKSRRASLFGILILLLTVAFIYFQARSVPIYSAYFGHFGINGVNPALAHFRELSKYLSEFWINGYSNAIRLALFVTLTGLAAVGYLARIRKRQITCFELFVPFYLGLLMVLPIEPAGRFLFPLIPLYLFYVFLGIHSLSRLAASSGQRAERFAFVGALVAILASYVGQYTRLDFGPIQNGVTKPEAQQLFDYVKREIGEQEVIIFRKPRALSLFTGRPAGVWHYAAEDRELWDFFQQVNASYLIVGPDYVEPYDQTYIRDFVDRNRERFKQSYSNADFLVYRILKDTT